MPNESDPKKPLKEIGGGSIAEYSAAFAQQLIADVTHEFFKDSKNFNQDAADKFRRNILSAGGIQSPAERFISFRNKRLS